MMRMPSALLLGTTVAACGAGDAPREPLKTAAAPVAAASPVAPDGCPADSLLLLADSADLPALEAARAPADSRRRRVARLTVARALMHGEQGLPHDPRRAYCLLRPLYDAGVLAASGDLGDLHRDAGELERAAQLYGMDFGSGFVEDRARPVRGSLPEVGASHRAWVRMSDLLRMHPDRATTLERAFREGTRAGYAQEHAAHDTL